MFKFYRMTMAPNNQLLTIKMLTKAFTAYIKVFRYYMGFADVHSGEFKDFYNIDTCSNACLNHQIICPVTLERYLRAITCSLQKAFTN